MTTDKKEPDPFSPDRTKSSFDPLNVAKAEGMILRRGLTGNYKKSAITRCGFVLMGLFLMSIAGLYLFFAVTYSRKESGDYILSLIFSLIGLFVFFLGFNLVKITFKK